MASVFENAEGERRLYLINSSNIEATVTLTIAKDETALPLDAAFAEADGAILDGIREENGLLILSCRLRAEGYGKIIW
jgi:hypothetical protein